MTTHVKTVAILTARPGQQAALRALLEGMIEPSRAEAGNLRYDLWVDQADPTQFVLDELYADGAALEVHRASPHFQAYRAAVGPLAERTALSLAAIAVA